MFPNKSIIFWDTGTCYPISLVFHSIWQPSCRDAFKCWAGTTVTHTSQYGLLTWVGTNVIESVAALYSHSRFQVGTLAPIMSCAFLYLSDVRTQADYQLLDPNFVGLIFSCFNEADKVFPPSCILVLILQWCVCRTEAARRTGGGEAAGTSAFALCPSRTHI